MEDMKEKEMKVLTQEEFDEVALGKELGAPLRFRNYIVKDITIDVESSWQGIYFINCRIENLKLDMSKIPIEDYYLYESFEVRFVSCEIVDPENYTISSRFDFRNCTFLKPVPLVCPEEGEFIGYKKCHYYNKKGYCGHCVVKLLILEDAKRSSAFTNKCRCNKARVIGIFDLDGNEIDCDTAYSMHIPAIRYEVGKEVYPDSFDEARYHECSHGIHFFMTFDEARDY